MEQQSPQGQDKPYHSIFQLALDRVDAGVWVIDEEWRLVYMNRVMEIMTRRSRNDLIGKNTISEEPWFLRGSFDLVRRIQEAKENKTPIDYAHMSSWISPGERAFHRGTIFPLITKSGRCRGAMVTVDEVTEKIDSLESISAFEKTIQAIDKITSSSANQIDQVRIVDTLMRELASWRNVDIAEFIFTDRISRELAVKIVKGVRLTEIAPDLLEALEREAAEAVKQGDVMIGTVSGAERGLEALVIPLMIDDASIGVLSLARKGRSYSHSESERFLAVGHTLARALNEHWLAQDNQRLRVRQQMIMRNANEGLQAQHLMKRREQQVEAINNLSRSSQSSFDLAEVLMRSLDTVAGVMGWKTGAGVYLLDRTRNTLVLVARKNIEKHSCCQKTEISLEDGVCGMCAKSGDLVVFDGHRAAEICGVKPQDEPSLTIAVPLKVKSEVLGVMFLYPEVVYHMSAVEKEILRTVGEQLGMMVKNMEMKHKITELSIIDEESGAYNFRRFIEQVQSEFQRAKRYREPFSIVNILFEFDDIEKEATGDEIETALAKAIASVTKRSTRNTDSVYRYGKNEFAVLLAATGKDGAGAFKKRLKSVFEKVADKYPDQARVRIGIGSVSCPDETENEMELIDWASKLARDELAQPSQRVKPFFLQDISDDRRPTTDDLS